MKYLFKVYVVYDNTPFSKFPPVVFSSLKKAESFINKEKKREFELTINDLEVY